MRKKRNILLVDGYNLIGAKERLFQDSLMSLELARDEMLRVLSEFAAVSKYKILCVFDAYEVKSKETEYDFHDVKVIFTKEKETADEYIERFVYNTYHPHLTDITVVTSDLPEQNAIFSYGAYRMSSREMWIELEYAEKNISKEVMVNNRKIPKSKLDIDEETLLKLEKLRRGFK